VSIPGRAAASSGFESVLEERLRAQGVAVQWNHRLADMRMLGSERGRHAAAMRAGNPAVMRSPRRNGSSSGRSIWRLALSSALTAIARQVRRSLNINTRKWGRPQTFAVFEFQCDQELGEEAHIVLDDQSVSALWPDAQGAGAVELSVDRRQLDQHSAA